MARQRTRVLRARKSEASRDDDTPLIRSAESLGRVIGSLQRQVQGSAKRMSTRAEDAFDALPDMPRMDEVIEGARQMVGRGTRSPASGQRKSPGARKAAGSRKRVSSRKAGGSRKSGGASKTAASKRTGARKAAATRKASRKRSRRASNNRS